MKNQHTQFLIVLLVTFLAIPIVLTEAQTTSDDEPVAKTRLVLADIDSDDPTGKVEQFTPLADYLASNLSEFGIEEVAIRIAPDLETMSFWMANGDVDLYYDSPYPTMIVSDESGAEVLLRRWRDGSPVYHSVFFTRADSPLETIENLNGQLIAFDHIASSSGFMLPMSYLISQDITPIEAAIGADVAADQVGYVFTNDDDNTIQWVISGRVGVGVVDNLTYVNDIPEEIRENLRILAETEEIPRQVMLANPDLDPELRAAVVELLTELDEAEEGQAILEILETDQFDVFPDGPDSAFEGIREAHELVVGQSEDDENATDSD